MKKSYKQQLKEYLENGGEEEITASREKNEITQQSNRVARVAKWEAKLYYDGFN